MKWVKGVKRYKLPVLKQMIHEDVMKNMASVFNNTILYI